VVLNSTPFTNTLPKPVIVPNDVAGLLLVTPVPPVPPPQPAMNNAAAAAINASR
jgi:hypothetical protein